MKKHSEKSHDSSMVSGLESVPILHNEKLSRAPRAKGHYHTDGGDPIAMVPQDEDRRIPSAPDSMKDRSRADKLATHGFADHKRARGRDYNEEPVRDAVEHNRSKHVPINEDAGSIESSGAANGGRMANTRNQKTVSSFSGRKYKA